MDLFEYGMSNNLKKSAPLADRMRPKTIDDIAGQKHILGPGKFINRIIKADKIPSIIFTGPPGTGKTTIAEIIARSSDKNFISMSAVSSGLKDVKEAVLKAEEMIKYHGTHTVIFIDEIHRFNKLQQDALLPYVERGVLTLIGATTENPYFEVNKALLSRSVVIPLYALAYDDLNDLLDRALQFYNEESFAFNVEITDSAKSYLIKSSSGDARFMLNGFEVAVLSSELKNGKLIVDIEDIKNSILINNLRYDKSSDMHYDTISAFIKSMRGSDPDAAIYYLAQMLNSGEDPVFIARRIVIFAAEDISNADPNAIMLAMSCFEAVNAIGMPESRIILAQAAVYMAAAPKSNRSYLAIDEALNLVKNEPQCEVPMHLRNKVIDGEESLGVGIGYKYPHNFERGWVDQQYLPDKLAGKVFYEPSDEGYERNIKEMLKCRKSK